MSDDVGQEPQPHGEPAVSVVMPVHNALPFLDSAIQSILDQSFGDFEFVILDDGSTDGSTLRLREWAEKEPRIRLIESEKNLGPAVSSQVVALAARAPIVARQDADDISYPTRLEEQLAVLDRNPDVGVVGGLYDIIGPDGRTIRKAERWRLVRQRVIPPFGNGPLMYRREVFDRVGGYREECEFWEDKDLIFRMAAVSTIMVIPKALYKVRQSPTSTRAVSDPARLERAADLARRCIARVGQNRSYEDLLANRGGTDEKVDPRIFIALGNVMLWAGNRPRILGRVIRRGRLGFNASTVNALIWAAWASASPSSLRLFLLALLRAKEALAAGGEPKGEAPVLWSPYDPALPLATEAREASARRRRTKVSGADNRGRLDRALAHGHAADGRPDATER